MTSVANQFAIAASTARIDQRLIQIRCGIASRMRKNTVTRERARSSRMMTFAGTPAMDRIFAEYDRRDHARARLSRRRARGARADRGAAAPDADAELPNAVGARRRPDRLQGRAAAADRRVQAARCPEQARDALGGGEAPR